jgi:hypothetical protein
MKRLLPLLLSLIAQVTAGQCVDEWMYFEFDDTTCLSRLTIDTVHYPQNIWQIGLPQKPVLDPTACHTRVIITDTLQPYPVNDTSVFTILSRATMGILFGGRMFEGQYYVQSDSLKDYGKIEFSPDLGVTWIDIINDTVYSNVFTWGVYKPVLTGHSCTCRYFEGFFGDVGSVFNLQEGDTLLFRFTFISDSIYDNLGGLIFDNLLFADFLEGISETRFQPIRSKIYPNPTGNVFTIEFDNPGRELFQLSVYNIQSKLMYAKENIAENKIVVDARGFEPGAYIYKLTNQQAPKRCWGKFITIR